jgi:Ca2+-binding RTX toxin-like protein
LRLRAPDVQESLMASPVTLTSANAIYRTGEYSIANNQWGTPQSMQNQAGSTSQITINDPDQGANDVSIQWQFPDSRSSSGVWGYLEVIWGGGPGWESAPQLRTQISNIKDLVIDYSVTNASPNSNLLIELWTTNAAGQPTAEVAVSAAGFRTPGSYTYSDQYITADVNANAPGGGGGGASWKFVTLSLPVDTLSGTVSFSNILSDLVQRGIVNPSDYVSGIELGIEPQRGSGAMQISNFAVYEALHATHTIAYSGTQAGQAFDITTNNNYVIDGGPLGAGTSIVRIDTPLALTRVDLLASGHIDLTNGRYGEIDLANIGEIRFSDARLPVSALSATPMGGTPGDDILHAVLGAPSVFAGLGDDTISSVPGWATATYLRGDEGDDSIAGAAGFDDINGNMGADTIDGGSGGDDWLLGGRENDLITAHASNNLIYGNIGDDTLSGGAGQDTIRGGQDNDIITGGAGNDFLSGDRGADTLTGGAGADTFHFFTGAGLERVTDFNLDQGDRVQLLPGTQYSIAHSGADTVITTAGGDQMILVGVSLSAGSWIFGA